MRVPLSLLRRYVPVEATVEELADTMNARIAEVEAIERLPGREAFSGVRIARVDALDERSGEHVLLHATTREGSLDLVVGERWGVRPGDRLAVVPAGHAAPDGTPVAERRLSGLRSQAMVLSEATAGIGEDASRPLRLAPDVEPGADPWTVLELDDAILVFDLEPNRPDLFSLEGMARDLAAIHDLPISFPPALDPDWPALPPDDLRVELGTDRVERYAAHAIAGVRVGPSPQWLQNAVRKLGMRPINNVVDAANLTMFEIGQPIHTFDRARLETGVIGLRMARPGERITTLDGVERTLTAECLLVTDGDRPIALAGVMGDARTEVSGATRDLVVESATFDMAAVRRCSRRLALRTEASLRFEKGLPPSAVPRALARFAWLIERVGGPEVRVGGVAEAWPHPRPPRIIDFSPGEARARLGMEVPDALIRRRFHRLGLEVGDDWRVRVPDHRPDLRIQEDLNEEVGRLHGYEHVVAEAPRAPLDPPRHAPAFTRARAIRLALAGAGWDEVHLGTWIGDDEVDTWTIDRERLLTLLNPVNRNLLHFRPSSLPHLAAAVRGNRRRWRRVALFEVGKVYLRGDDGEPVERHHLAGALAEPGDDPEGHRVLRARDALLVALDALGLPGRVGREPVPPAFLPHAFHPGRTATVAHEGKVVGLAGSLHPDLVAALDLPEAPVLFQLDLEALLDRPPVLTRFTPPPRFPSVQLHVNVVVPRTVLAGELLERVRAAGLAWLADARVLDAWSGADLPPGHRRITVGLSFNHPERSLTQEEALAELRRLPERLPGLQVER